MNSILSGSHKQKNKDSEEKRNEGQGREEKKRYVMISSFPNIGHADPCALHGTYMQINK